MDLRNKGILFLPHALAAFTELEIVDLNLDRQLKKLPVILCMLPHLQVINLSWTAVELEDSDIRKLEGIQIIRED